MNDIINTEDMTCEERAAHWLDKTGSTLTKSFDSFNKMPWDKGSDNKRNVWNITLTTDGKDFNFQYGDSIHNSCQPKIKTEIYQQTDEVVEPSDDSILIAISPYYVDSNIEDTEERFQDFCDNLGYDSDSRDAYKSFEETNRHTIVLEDMYTSDELEQLGEIDQ